jgi:nitrate reductase alpha subunit
MKRSFDEYLTEAIDKGWWNSGLAQTYRDGVKPRVLFESGGNMLRRQRGGQRLLLDKLWPDLKLIVSVDFRINTTGLYSDYILPAAQHYEKIGNSMPSVHHLNYVLCDKAVDPPDGVKNDWDIGIGIVAAIEQRAKEREMTEFTDRHGVTRQLTNLVDSMTLNGALFDEETRVDEAIKDDAAYGILPPDSSLETARQKGAIRWTGWGLVGHGLGQASTIKPDEVHNPFRWHTEDKLPYPTLTRRAQFYIDHEWFLEAGEELPVHKEPPGQGGPDRQFKMTSGHNRWSIHSMNITNKTLLDTHRGRPHIVINDSDAARLNIREDEEVEVHNDLGAFIVPVKRSPSVRPGQVISYNGWEPYMYRTWKGASDLEPGMVKWLHFAGGYGHLRYWPFQWQPVPFDRGVRVNIAKLD